MYTKHPYKDLGTVHITCENGKWNFRAMYRTGALVGDYKSLKAAKAALTQWHNSRVEHAA